MHNPSELRKRKFYKWVAKHIPKHVTPMIKIEFQGKSFFLRINSPNDVYFDENTGLPMLKWWKVRRTYCHGYPSYDATRSNIKEQYASFCRERRAAYEERKEREVALERKRRLRIKELAGIKTKVCDEKPLFESLAMVSAVAQFLKTE